MFSFKPIFLCLLTLLLSIHCVVYEYKRCLYRITLHWENAIKHLGKQKCLQSLLHTTSLQSAPTCRQHLMHFHMPPQPRARLRLTPLHLGSSGNLFGDVSCALISRNRMQPVQSKQAGVNERQETNEVEAAQLQTMHKGFREICG